jgi:Zn-finger nucleic acid-binding protein
MRTLALRKNARTSIVVFYNERVNAVTAMTCPGCGAGVSPDVIACGYCQLTLATLACPGCFARMVLGCKHCPHCGVLVAPLQGEASGAPCPACKHELHAAEIGTSKVNECDTCGGIWINVDTFRAIVADRDGAIPLGAGSPVAAPRVLPKAEPVRYRACPACTKMMNRVNFGRISGVVVDVCKGHGTWFDAGELRDAVAFVRSGGLAEKLRRRCSPPAAWDMVTLRDSSMACRNRRART